MNLKKKLRKFFTLSRKANGGFTLVELIVVIAILAILGGVAVPAYSGYVKKADLAADEALLNAVNKAFAAACAENGTDAYNVPEQPELELTAERAVDEVTPYTQEFDKYFAGNEGAKFKTENTVVFDGLKGAFVLLVDGSTVFMKYGDDLIPISAEDVKKLANSTFINADGLGVEGLLNKVDFVATVAGSINNGAMYESIINDDDYMRKFLENLGVEGVSELSGRPLKNAFRTKSEAMSDAMLSKMAKENGWTEEMMNSWTAEERAAYIRDADAKVKANMAVLYAAQSTKDISDADITALLNTDNPKETIMLGATGGDKLAQAALYYGMYVSYAHYKGETDLINATEDPFEFFRSNDLDTEGFQDYINNTEQGKADLEAYIASMNIVADSTTKEGAVNDVIVNGFNNEKLVSLIQQAVGK